LNYSANLKYADSPSFNPVTAKIPSGYRLFGISTVVDEGRGRKEPASLFSDKDDSMKKNEASRNEVLREKAFVDIPCIDA
jgi:hypothetical protein